MDNSTLVLILRFNAMSCLSAGGGRLNDATLRKTLGCETRHVTACIIIRAGTCHVIGTKPHSQHLIKSHHGRR